MIKKASQLISLKLFIKKFNFFSNFIDEKHFSVNEKYSSDYKFLIIADNL